MEHDKAVLEHPSKVNLDEVLLGHLGLVKE